MNKTKYSKKHSGECFNCDKKAQITVLKKGNRQDLHLCIECYNEYFDSVLDKDGNPMSCMALKKIYADMRKELDSHCEKFSKIITDFEDENNIPFF